MTPFPLGARMVRAGIPPTLAASPDHGYTGHFAQERAADEAQPPRAGFMEGRRGGVTQAQR